MSLIRKLTFQNSGGCLCESNRQMDRAARKRALNTTQSTFVAPPENNSSTRNSKPYSPRAQSENFKGMKGPSFAAASINCNAKLIECQVHFFFLDL